MGRRGFICVKFVMRSGSCPPRSDREGKPGQDRYSIRPASANPQRVELVSLHHALVQLFLLPPSLPCGENSPSIPTAMIIPKYRYGEREVAAGRWPLKNNGKLGIPSHPRFSFWLQAPTNRVADAIQLRKSMPRKATVERSHERHRTAHCRHSGRRLGPG